MNLILLRFIKLSFVLILILWPVQSPGFYVALDPNALTLDAHSGHEELTRQAYEYLQNKWKAEGRREYYSRLENEFDALYQITRGVYATDVDEALKNFDLMGMRFGPHQVAPPMTLLGVTRLAIPGLLFEIEATAMA